VLFPCYGRGVKFIGELAPEVRAQVDLCDFQLTNPARLEALARTELMGSPKDASFDRLAELAAKLLHVPLTIISLVSDKTQFFKAAFGLPPQFENNPEIPIDGSICRYTLKGTPIVAPNAAIDPLLRHHPATGPWGVGAFISIPMITPDGYVLGAFCAVDAKEREWSTDDVAVMEELTKSAMTEISLRDQIREFTAEKKLREAFVNTLTHDLRTPLTAAKMTAELLLRKARPEDGTQNQINRIIHNMDRADAMIRDLLDTNLLRAGETIALNLSDGRMDEIVDTTVRELTVVHGSRFQIRNEAGVVAGYWDHGRITRMLENMATNAVKYGAVEKPITVRLVSKDGELELSVHNEGEPISSEDQKLIFNSFHRTERARKGHEKGWGIGLSLVKGIAERHGGSVRVDSHPARGTTFTIRLPLRAAQSKG
jgi:signal transduction histidine kinase